MLQVAVPIWLHSLEIWEKWHTCELVGNRKSPKRQKVFCRFADERVMDFCDFCVRFIIEIEIKFELAHACPTFVNHDEVST